MTEKDIEKLLRESKELAPRPGLKSEILQKAESEKASAAVKSHGNHFLRRLSVSIAACFVFLVTLAGVSTGLYFENYETVYLDLNPSVSLQINRFEVVNKVTALNDDAKSALDGVVLTGKSAENALEILLDTYDKAEYFDNSELYISVYSEKNKNCDKLLAKMCEKAEALKNGKSYTVNGGNFSKEEKEEAAEIGIPPMKYKLITEILAIHPELTCDDLRDKKMSELKAILNGDKTDNGNNGNDNAGKQEGNGQPKDND